ncbi:efflux RND transporter periplasmic adaptor subunit [Ferruginibacter sp. HRS2-29]|uniref:efflux RND transporter periplasmic adaptor subunit n=1 Tax=Ferruginibacter sp. HRS2-29 TaxID=2487334 RepID=UPI0020CF6543|nr:efflux RND transporter periplasmic adaptor subunit [Ferruginibacter sp. HRS2-29]MCP9750823.1 efflux RND transporter periplasmic adaptor subunit [Ferruginibacter sp. HRS2-29]
MKKLPVYFLLSVSGFYFLACKNKTPEAITDTRLCLTDTLKRNIKIDSVKNEPVKNLVTLSGKIEANEDKWVKIFPVVGGVVEQMKVELGDYVTKGQILAVIRSSEIAEYQSQSAYAHAAVKIAEKNLSSAEDMFSSGLATEKDVVAAQTDLEKAKADLRRIQQTTSIFGAKSNAIQTITAPVSGYIIEKNVTDKMQFRVDGAQPFFIIANLEEVWVMANVFESDITKIKAGDDADIKLIAYKDKIFTGKVDRIFNMLDPQSRVMKVRIKIPNKENLIKPEMFAQIKIRYDDGAGTMPAIAADAVIFDKNKDFVMLYKDDCDIEVREVEIFQTIGDKAYLKSGLAEGDKVITKYQLLVYNAVND